MDIGYFRFVEDNINTKELNAVAHSFYGLNLIFFGPKDINYETKIIKGKQFTGNGWETKEVLLPKIINNMRFKNVRKDNKLYNFLNENSMLLFHSFGNKDYIERLLEQNKLLDELLIPSKIVEAPGEILEMFNNHNKIIFKPTDGQTGRGIFTIEKDGQGYICYNQEITYNINESELINLLRKLKSSHIAQKYIRSVTPKNLPFDIRVHYEKNGKGKWIKAQTYARVGLSNELVSNIAKGGSVIRAGLFLRTNFGEEKGKELLRKLNDILKGFPSEFEKLFDFNVSTIAIDLGLYEDDFYLFEVNSFPGGTFARGEIAMLRAAHTKYLAEHLYQEELVSIYNLAEKSKKLNIENQLLNSKINAMINSRSWRYTSFLRKKG